ncbi:MAG TPA: twin-arginine translocation signal domain-containing protein [Longimicrobium sp.]|jgi:hypothetical protein
MYFDPTLFSDAPLGEEAAALISRRKFLGVSAAVVASGSLISADRLFASNPGEIQVPAVIGYVGRYAAAIGSTVIADLVSEYVRTRPTGWLRQQLESVNNFMYTGGFINFGRSRVFDRFGKIFYPVIHRDGFNACVAFHDIRRQDPRIPMVEGPTVVGLTLAAEEVARRTSRETARQLFHPTRAIERGTGTFETNYATPDQYESAGGARVTMNYRNDGPGRGTVAVFAEGPINPNEWGNLFNRQYSLRFA